MRIALLVPTLEVGGVERVFANLATGMHERGNEVEVVVGSAGGAMTALVEKDVSILVLGSKHIMRSVPRLANYLRSRKPEVLIAGMTHCSAAAVTARLIARQETKIIATEHNTMSLVIANTAGVKYRMMPVWGHAALSMADAVVAVSDGVAGDLSKQTGIARNRIRVIYNPVIHAKLFAAAAEDVRHPWFQPGQPPVVLGVGRLEKQKDFPMLVRAFRLLRERRRARLMILGEGPDRTRIEQAISDAGLSEDVALPGSENNPSRFMSRAAVFAMSSLWEGFGMALVEALALGIPVVSTNCAHGPEEILCDGRFGALVPVGDHESMAHRMIAALENPVRNDATVHLKQFSVDVAVSQYLSLIAQLRSQRADSRN